MTNGMNFFKKFQNAPRKKVTLASALLAAAAITLGCVTYISFFQKDGLDKLPAKPCHGAISRETIRKMLKDTESVDLRTFQTKPDASFWTTCNVFTQEGSGFHVEARINDSGIPRWREWQLSQGEDEGKPVIDFKAGDRAISWPRRASLYLKCTPELEKDKPSEQYAIAIETHIRGSMRIDGEELRQTLANIAIEMAHYAQRKVKCQEKTYLPAPGHPVPS
ncbi:hypothetical protein B7755_033070 [Streptomyces sp. NBS 14/10]|uniref:hypothetical protein n=1 Tax=Streptomyces sp. NBS 14/10 TaxID=1945643 RepID=UPI001180F816|nr:hypothetical protein [Streptomyces sp. NBS 14/10]KAK1182540.1 hypothetical protein B7755_033070 [Streptomyces sp. NBS 14/10]